MNKNGFPLVPLALAVTSCFASSTTLADNDSLARLQEEIRWLKEEHYVTTATKTKESLKKSGATMSVITADDLKKMGARNLMDALKRVPGFGINRFNMGTSSVEVRGVKTDFSEKILFLINGHGINNNIVNGGALSSFNNFQIKDIKVIEIVRGPGSALYGTNAFSGVINIITKDAKDIEGAELSFSAGSNESRRANILLGTESDTFEITTNINVYDSDGLDTYLESDALGLSGNIDHWQKRYEFGLQTKISAFALQTRYVRRESGAYLGAIGSLNDDSHQIYEDFFLEGSYNKRLSNSLSVSTKLYYDQFQFDNLWEIFPEGFELNSFVFEEGLLVRSPVKNQKIGGEFQLTWNLSSSNKLLSGIALEKHKQTDVEKWTNNGSGPLVDVSSYDNWNDDHEREISAFYIQDIWDIQDDLRLIAGARYDHYDDFGSTVNPRASISWEINKKHQLVATYGSAFRAPTFGELYNINNPSIVGNPDVEAEEIDTIEFGLRSKLGRRNQFKGTLFHNKIDDIIAPRASGTAAVSDNIGELEVTGIELEFDSRLKDGSTVSLNYTYQDPSNKLDDTRAPDVPLHRANLMLNYRYSKNLSAFAGVLYESSLSRVANDTRSDVPEMTTLDLAMSWRANKAMQFTASLYNALDEDVVDPSPAGVMISDFPRAGRNFMLEIEIFLDEAN